MKHEDGDAHVYDQPEPDWVSSSLKCYHDTIRAVGQDQSEVRSKSGCPAGFPLITTEASITADCLDFLFDNPEAESTLTGPLAPSALTALLNSLAQRVPYPRLSEALHCVQLTWDHVLAMLARYRSDCIVLQANLAEAKSHADRIQCQLNQIDANWTAAMRAAWLADASLEIIDSLNQLYATELAIMLYRQTKKSFLAAQAFSTLSSSTSSSSIPRRGKSVQITCSTRRPVIHGSGGPGRPTQSSNPSSLSSCSAVALANPSSPQHPYAIYAVPGYAGTDYDVHTTPSGPITAQFTLNLRTLQSFRYQAEISAQALLDRYEQLDSNTPDRFYPTVSSTSTGPGGPGGNAVVTGNGGITSASLNRALSRTQNMAPISPGLLSIHSPLGPPVPSTQSLTGSSVYANSWYVSLGRLGRSNNGPTPAPEQTSIGSGGLGSGYLINQNKLTNLNYPLGRGSTKSIPHPHPTGVGVGGIGNGTGVGTPGVINSTNGCGGWQTPDSGAGSSSTHEVTQPVLFPTVFPPGLIELGAYDTVLDLMPPVLIHPNATGDGHVHSSFCDTDSDSSDSSDGDPGAELAPIHPNIPASVTGLTSVGQSTGTGPPNESTQSTPIPISTGWSRSDERKLRVLLHQLIHSRRVLRSTIVEQLPSNLTDDDGLSDGHQSVSRESFPTGFAIHAFPNLFQFGGVPLQFQSRNRNNRISVTMSTNRGVEKDCPRYAER
ncbi:unnamed protein product [Echinostoma caproni]|uniref:PH-response transcription factor pacC/RIM101 n=1 Tax=Echinostoma caproni TaxID=27848 RepID=A0A183AHP6_9TREM|nr:unnamed protein product [Echinostoma caproni]